MAPLAEWMAAIGALLAGHDLLATVVLLLVAIVLRRLVPPTERRRATTTAGVLLVTLALRLASAAMAGTGSGRLLVLLGDFGLALGAVGIVGGILFDLVLGRAGVRIPSILRDLVQATAIFVVLLVVLRQAGVDLISLVTTSAVLTAVIGFALQNTIANVFAGLALHMDRTLQIGDWIRVGDRVGLITEIKWRSTSILTRDGDIAVVPNGHLVNTEVLNYSRPASVHRVAIRVGFHYRHPPNTVKHVLTNALLGIPGVLENLPRECFVVDFGESAVTYVLRWWIGDFAQEEYIVEAARSRVWYAAERAGLEIPFPIRTVVTRPEAAGRPEAAADSESAERLAAVAVVDLFAPLAEADRAALAKAMRRARFAEGEEIIRQGDPGGSMFIVREGEVRVVLAVDGASREIATLGPGDVVGEMSLMTGEPRNATCRASTDVVCYVVDHPIVRRLVDVHPRLAGEMSEILARRQLQNEGERASLSVAAQHPPADATARLLERMRSFLHLK